MIDIWIESYNKDIWILNVKSRLFLFRLQVNSEREWQFNQESQKRGVLSLIAFID